MVPRMILPRLAVIGLVFAFLHVPGRALGQGNLNLEAAELAKEVKSFLDGQNESSVAVGQFIGPPSMPSSAGPAIAMSLTDELKKLDVVVKPRCNLTVEGRYRDVVDEKSDRVAVEIDMKIVDRAGKEKVQLSKRGVFGDASIAALMGVSVVLPPDSDEKTRDARLHQSLEKPRAHLKGTRILAGAGSPLSIEILVKDNGAYVARTPKDEDGLAQVPIPRDHVYAVRIYNDSDHEMAATLTIDGLNMFSFSDVKNAKGRPRYSQVIVAKGKSVTVKGWHRTNESSNEFQVMEYAKSAAAELHSTANIGTITVSYAACWPTNGKPPADEPSNPRTASRSADATGRGANIGIQFEEVERNFGVVRGAVSVRYAK